MIPANEGSYPGQVKKILRRWSLVLAAVALVALWATWRMHTAASRLPERAAGVSSGVAGPVVEYWTCTMHPDVRQPGPGDCPKCGMELVPKYAGSDELGVPPATPAPPKMTDKPASRPRIWYKCTMAECNDVGSDDPNSRCPVCGMKREPVGLDSASSDLGEHEITLSQRAQRLAELATEPVARRRLFKRIRTVGKVTYDETRHKMVSAWTGGRIDRLFADYTGMVVEQRDHLVEIYSPELFVAQQAYLLDLNRSSEGTRPGAGTEALRAAQLLRESSRGKLELLGLTRAQIEAIEESGTPMTHLVIHAPLGGTVVRKVAMEGMYVRTGDVLYEIADLTHVWLLLDLYEADLPWVLPFQEVRVTAESLPGEEFRGQIVFVDPVVDKTTRTIKVRVNVNNPQRQLKPQMFVTAEIHVPVAQGGRAATPEPDADFACPMHPWEQAETPAECPICGMDMAPVASLAGRFQGGEAAEILSVPREAVMKTGERALAYVEVGPGHYRGVEVEVGPLAEDASGRQFYPILNGLAQGQWVVTRGNFVIDSQMQIAGKPSLFHARGLGPAPSHEKPATEDASARQTVCPVLGHEINPDVFTVYKGVKVYVCCEPCISEFETDPDKYIPKLPAAIQERMKAATTTREGSHHD